MPTITQQSSSEESLDDFHMTEQAIPPMQDSIVPSHATYWKLLRTNRPFLFYIISYFLDRIGEWFTYVATINAIIHASSHSNTAVAAIIAIRTIPNIVFSSIGGGLADSTDRRVTMISLNIIGMLVSLLYLPAYHFRSLPLIYVVAFIQASVAAIYDPVRRSIIPLLVPQQDYLQKATTMSEIAFATMASAGATFGGITASTFGVSVCSG
jgi:MFS family permease